MWITACMTWLVWPKTRIKWLLWFTACITWFIRLEMAHVAYGIYETAYATYKIYDMTYVTYGIQIQGRPRSANTCIQFNQLSLSEIWYHRCLECNAAKQSTGWSESLLDTYVVNPSVNTAVKLLCLQHLRYDVTQSKRRLTASQSCLRLPCALTLSGQSLCQIQHVQ